MADTDRQLAEESVVPTLPLLVVDDEPQVLRALELTLRDQDWQIVAVSSPETALAELAQREYAVVVSDYAMPHIDGVVVLTEASKRWPNAERVLLSAHADEEALERGINDAAIHRIMRKPWRTNSLIAVLEQAIAQNRLRRERAVLMDRMRNRNDELTYLNQLLRSRVLEGDRAIINFRRRWDAALDAILDPILIVNPSLRIEGCNRAAAQLSNQSREQLEGQVCHSALFGRSEPCEECPLDGTGVVHRVTAGNRIFEVTAYPLPGERSAHLGVYRDVTQSLALSRQAAHTQKMVAVGRLASGVAHELNNPLQSIFSFVQLAEKDNVTPDKLARYLSIIRDSAARCSQIVSALRDFSRRDREEQHQEVNLNEVCEKAVSLFASRHARIEQVLSAVSPRALGNGSQLHQVMVNLIQNAVDASPEGGVIRVLTEVDGDEVVVAVEDEGDGIADDDLERVFEPFFSTNPEGTAIGLGLSISQTIIREHGGKLIAGHTEKGGARFSLRLPLTQERQ